MITTEFDPSKMLIDYTEVFDRLTNISLPRFWKHETVLCLM